MDQSEHLQSVDDGDVLTRLALQHQRQQRQLNEASRDQEGRGAVGKEHREACKHTA